MGDGVGWGGGRKWGQELREGEGEGSVGGGGQQEQEMKSRLVIRCRVGGTRAAAEDSRKGKGAGISRKAGEGVG